MNIPSIVITDDMSPVEKAAAAERGIALELAGMAETIGWQMLTKALAAKIERLVGELTSTVHELDARAEDRKRGEIAAYRDVIASVEKSEATARRLEQQAANHKEKSHERAAAERDVNPFRDFPGFE